MPRTVRPATGRQHARLKDAIACLVEARKCLRDAGCPATLRKVLSALKSAEGAQRHMQRRRATSPEKAPQRRPAADMRQVFADAAATHRFPGR